ncbi:hypothetical protein CRE_29076 [Caenorhabditis remanei]|uniref:Uncharacterized protein n=1 Tax=Caenorhabditis remanei TaxID=31234 RepID=E3MWA0_CAERE|nr:hypothetical protein CRE_29076 [Caenorhabditis remanei]
MPVNPETFIISWILPINNKQYKIQLEQAFVTNEIHIRVDEKEVYEHLCDVTNYFRPPDRNYFKIDGIQCCVIIEEPSFGVYKHSLVVGGKAFREIKEEHYTKYDTWKPVISGKEYLVVMEKHAMNTWVDGNQIDLSRQFTDHGTVAIFHLNGTPCKILTECIIGGASGMKHSFFVNNNTEVSLFEDSGEVEFTMDTNTVIEGRKKETKNNWKKIWKRNR